MTKSRLQFAIEAVAEGSRARAARFQTLHNVVETPLFMPVGTQATVKAQLPEMLLESGSQILLANTYHLLLRPGVEVFERFGGIHGFMKWERSVLTDSGGFQIFSLPHSRAMTEEGAAFQSYVDGQRILLSPERSIATQRAIGSDIMMVLDQCIPSTASETLAREALGITTRWAARSLKARGDSPQSLFAIVQGALYPELRQESAARLTEMPFDGFAIGGLAVGEGKAEREDTCELTAALLPADRPRYLMGVGTPIDLLEAVHRGVDMFDCIIPTQMAQRGAAFTSRGLVQLRRSIYKFDAGPLDPNCACPVCQKHSRAYLHHLHKTQETLGWTLLGQHNIFYYHQLMREIRRSILEGRFLSYYHEKREVLDREDVDNPVQVPKPKRHRRGVGMTLGAYEIHTAEAGFSSIRHRDSGEIMHSHTPPLDEAMALYVEQADLGKRLTDPSRLDVPLRIWDVGLGAAANAMAAVQCYEELAQRGPVRPMELVSFENDLDSLRLALHHKTHFAYLRHGAPDALLHRGNWQSRQFPGLSWQLVLGDFPQTISHAPATAPELIFYDMFSTRSVPWHWTAEVFSRIHDVCGAANTEIYTYTTSTAVRVALLAAGFHVARGVATGPKSETTIALTAAAVALPLGKVPSLLGAEWLGRWERSHTKYPAELPAEDQADFADRIRQHPQFCLDR